MNQAVFAGRPDVLITVGEMPGVTVEDAVLFTDPARREVDMVFQFEHVSLDSGPGGKWDIKPLRLLDLKASLGRWQAGLAETGWNSLYWDNHDQPRAVSRFGDDGEFRVQSAKLLATVLHLHRGTPYVYQGEELGMTNVPFAGPADFRDIESVNHFAVATAAGDDPNAVLAALRLRSRDNARTPMQWDASAAAGFTTGSRGLRSTRITWRSMPPPRSTTRNRCSRTSARSSSCGTPIRWWRTAISPCCCPTDDRVYAFTRSWQGSTLLVVGNFSGEPAPAPVPDEAAWAAAELVLGNYPPPTAGRRSR